MGFWRQLLGIETDGSGPASGMRPARAPMASVDGGVSITTAQQLEEALRNGNLGSSGQAVTTETAMRVATVFACVKRRAGAIANTPVGIKRRVDDRTREDATDHPVWRVLNRRPNKWQSPSQFKRMMEAHIQLRGNAYAFIGRDLVGQVTSLTPLHPDRVRTRQLDDMTIEHVWTRRDGTRVTLRQNEVFHLIGLSLDGVTGLSTLAYARESIGLALAQERHGGTVFKNGANVTGALKMPAGRSLTTEQVEGLRAQMDDFRAGGARDGKVIVLEDGLEFQQMALTAQDAQWLESRKFSRTDICMFFDVPPHIVGIVEGNSQLGSSIEQQTQAYVTFSIEDSFVSWEEAIGLQCLDWDRNPDLFARFNRNALVRGDIKTRWESYVKSLQWGVRSPNDIRQLEDENPREGGDIYYPPPNMTAATEGNPRDVDS